MMEQERFATLRGLLSEAQRDKGWRKDFWSLLEAVHEQKDEGSKGIWLDYCEEHKASLPQPLKECHSLEELQRCAILAPFALFSLRLIDHDFGIEETKLLANSPHLASLTALHMWGNVGAEGAKAILRSPHLLHLTTLRIGRHKSGDTDIGEEGAKTIANSPHLASLTALHMWGNVGAEAARAFANSTHLTRLAEFSLFGNNIGDEGAIALKDAPHLRDLDPLGEEL